MRKAAVDNKHSFMFKVDDDTMFLKAGTESFLVDCGATTHIVNKDENFIDIDSTFNPEDHYVELADGTRSNNVAKKRGTVLTKLQTEGGKLVEVKLMNVLFVPTYPQCIFSVQVATKAGCKLNFHENKAELIAPDGNTVFPVQQHGRLYYLCKNTVESKRTETLKTWHQILGHCNPDDVSQMETAVQGMKISDCSKFDCETCTLAKQLNTRSREPREPRATYPLELVHTDLAGPIDPLAKEGFRYAIIFTDDFSGCMFTYFLKEKSDATRATEKFLADVSPYGKVKTLSFNAEIEPSGDVKRIRSDNGGEFTSNEFMTLLLKHSIKHEKSAPYSPHQNGTAERSWRTLFEMARALIIESKLPKNLWTYAIMTAAHIRNRCYSQRIKSTPYGLITGLKPNIAKLHIFGTICYPYVHNAKKLEPRSKLGIFVGYDRDSPSYLVYDPESKSVSKNRLVKFIDKFNRNVEDEAKLLEPVRPAEPEQAETEHPADPDDVNKPNRYPSRHRQPPNYLQDYDVNNDSEFEDYVNSVDYCYFLNAPVSYEDAMKRPDTREWKRAMTAEIDTLNENETFITTNLPEGKSLVGGKWVFVSERRP